MSVNESMVTPRPTSVGVAVAIGWISVVLDVVGGISLILLSSNDAVLNAIDTEGSTATTYGIISLVMAAVLALVVSMLGKGSNVARMLVTIVMLVRIGVAVGVLIGFGSHQFGEAILVVAIAVTALALLWNEKANAFFATNHP